MCRNIKLLYNFEPPATDEEIRASALQYVRKVSGMPKPSKANAEALEAAVDAITAITRKLLHEQLVTTGEPRDRATEAERARERGRKRDEQQRARLLGSS